MKRLALVAVLLLGGVHPPAAGAQGVISETAAALKKDFVFVHPDAEPSITAAEADLIRREVANGEGLVIVAVLPGVARQEVGGDADDVLRAVARAVGENETYAVVVGGQFRAGTSDPAFQPGEVPRMATQAFRAHSSEGLAATLIDFVRRVNAGDAGDPGGDGGGLDRTQTILLVGGGGVLLTGVGLAYRRRRRRETVALKRAVNDDLVALGDEIRELDLDMELPRAKEEARTDYTTALDAYERAGKAVDNAARPEDLAAATAALEEGRFAMASTRARLEGRVPPDRRPPCFFDPRHGPSVRDMEWAPEGGAPRMVPVCQADAFALAEEREPEIRKIQLGRRRVPYWEAGGFGPYADGYFGGAQSLLLPALLIGTPLGFAIGADDAAAHDSSPDSFDDSGGGDFGGGDFGGNGGDFGGGDFGGGGGDFGGGGNGGD